MDQRIVHFIFMLYFNSIDNFCLVAFLAQTLGIPAMKLLGIQDTVILILLGTISMVSRVVDCIAKQGWMFYAGINSSISF